MLKKPSSQELLHQMEQSLAWSIAGTRRFRFVQIKSLGLKMASPKRDTFLYTCRFI